MKQKNMASMLSAAFLGVIALSIAYYFVIFLPSKERMSNELEKEKQALETKKIKTEEQEKIDKQRQFDDCIQVAYDDYIADWKLKAEQVNPGKKTLPKYVSDVVEADHDRNEELCVKKYK